MYYGYLETMVAKIQLLLPNLLAALLVLLIGWIIAVFVSAVVRHALLWTGIDGWLEQNGVNKTPASSKNRPSYLISVFVKWLIFIGAVGVAAEVLNLASVSAFVGSLLAYVPNVLVAGVILVIGFIAAERVSGLLTASTGITRLSEEARFVISKITKYAILIFAIMAALTQLNIVPRLIEIAFAGLVFALALAFGLGGRDHASEFIARMKDKSKNIAQ